MHHASLYQKASVVHLPNRTWPDKTITHAPKWCSVDLRDGNQSLVVPMTIETKLRYFDLLLACGFKEIEVGFPAASKTEYDFIRILIEERRIPDDVTIQVLVQARDELIEKTIESLVGAKRAIIHLYNSTSPAQRNVVFGMSKQQIIDLAVSGAESVHRLSKYLHGTHSVYEYSPESFTSTELSFAKDICEAVIDVYNPRSDHKMIINLPATVEVATPNIYADQIEWFSRNIKRRDAIIISMHTHNDRGTGVAATELGLLAGGERVEGTLFGNGERTGNLDIVTVALNLYTQGVDPLLDFSSLPHIEEVYKACTKMTIHPRHPYAGELVFTAFSGSHQDAIRKGMRHREALGKDAKDTPWNVPYLPLNPTDIGKTYQAVIRVNGQSGKGGIAYLLEHEHGLSIPDGLVREFGKIAGEKIDIAEQEFTSEALYRMFLEEYVRDHSPFQLLSHTLEKEEERCSFSGMITYHGNNILIDGVGRSASEAFVNALTTHNIIEVRFLQCSSHVLVYKEKHTTIAYTLIEDTNHVHRYGVGIGEGDDRASIFAVISALNRI